MIYGGPFGVMPAIPAKLPPMFLAWAQDDTLARQPIVKFYDALLPRATNPRRTSSAPAATASVCASRAPAAITGSMISMAGWKRRDSPGAQESPVVDRLSHDHGISPGECLRAAPHTQRRRGEGRTINVFLFAE